MNSETHTQGFAALDVAPALCDKLATLGITVPTPIQAESIPIAMRGEDLIGIAQTGTGKTLAFGIPISCKLERGQCALVLAPTRELAQQIAESLEPLRLRCALVVGGAAMRPQISHLKNRPDVIIATPGRLMDHLNQGTADLSRVVIAVLDEADRMLDMGFAPSIRQIFTQLPERRQTLLFSATMPKDIAELAHRYLKHPRRVEVAREGTPAELIEHEVVVIEHEEKQDTLHSLLHENRGSILVFARTRHGARKLAKSVRREGHEAAELHSDRTLAQRREALQGFKSGQYRVLVATDIAARGIDVKDISLVINFDVPDCPDEYVHRIGRTGRAGSTGRAITLAIPAQAGVLRDIERLIGESLRISDRSTLSLPDRRPSRGPSPSSQKGQKSKFTAKPKPTWKKENRPTPSPTDRPAKQRFTSSPKSNGPKPEATPKFTPTSQAKPTPPAFQRFDKKKRPSRTQGSWSQSGPRREQPGLGTGKPVQPKSFRRRGR